MDNENIIEVFTYNKWQLCVVCEKDFFTLVDSFFNDESRIDHGENSNV